MPLSEASYHDLGHVPIGIGAIAKGWGMTEEKFRDHTRLSVVDFRAMTEQCRLNCFDCFAREEKTLSLHQIKNTLDQIAEIGATGINFLGEGEPMMDPDFFPIVDHAVKIGLQPAIFTDAIDLQDHGLVRRLFEADTTVFPKCDSIFDEEYQNWKAGDTNKRYFRERKNALDFLLSAGFNRPNEDSTTRLGFDMVVTKRNIDEIPQTLRWCRERNIFIIFSRWLPTGKCARSDFDNSLAVSREEMIEMGEIVQKIDREEFGFDHRVYSNFLTFPCVERLQILGNGDVTPCPGNETVIGNVLQTPLDELHSRLLTQYPHFNPRIFDGNCWCRK